MCWLRLTVYKCESDHFVCYHYGWIECGRDYDPRGEDTLELCPVNERIYRWAEVCHKYIVPTSECHVCEAFELGGERWDFYEQQSRAIRDRKVERDLRLSEIVDEYGPLVREQNDMYWLVSPGTPDFQARMDASVEALEEMHEELKLELDVFAALARRDEACLAQIVAQKLGATDKNEFIWLLAQHRADNLLQSQNTWLLQDVHDPDFDVKYRWVADKKPGRPRTDTANGIEQRLVQRSPV